MPLQNRVTPDGEIVAVVARGTMMGNRGGALHGPDKVLGRRRWVSRQWIACRLAFNDRHREVMALSRYTELFFLDEVTALAAGHRPCFECRRADALRFAALWNGLRHLPRRATAAAIDAVLHAERLMPDGRKRTYVAPIGDLPAGAIIRYVGAPYAVVARNVVTPWSFDGYGATPFRVDPCLLVEVLTPLSIVAVLGAGYEPQRHPTWPAGAAP